jgi:superfamily II DNA/RNA helicase
MSAPACSDVDLFGRLAGAGQKVLGRFQRLTEAQRAAIPPLLDHRPVLLVARTASGKTEGVIAPLLTLASQERWRGAPSILYVAPTRALVNDINDRLGTALSGFVDVGRRTGEYREPDRQLLVTTPESLDSMLARGATPGGHVLRHVRAVVLDELHLLAESARGTQLQVLLARLDEVAEGPVLRAALSATVPTPERLAWRFLGPDAVVCQVPGARPLRIDRSGGDGPLPGRGDGIDPLASQLWRVSRGDAGYALLAERLLAIRRASGKLKALVFVPSRARCDRLTADLTRALAGRAPVEVHAHHGSLDQQRREATELALSDAEESIAVATSTLELGIDVGDVGLVVLDGPPGSVSSLLQRTGRANRRSSEVFVVPVVANDVEACILASLLRSSVQGELDPLPEVAHFSVAIQQLASLLFQSAGGRRTRAAVEAILAAAFGVRSAWLVEGLLEEGWLRVPRDGFLAGGDPLKEIMDAPMRLHGNIGGAGAVVPLVDAVTGDALAWVPRGQKDGRIVLAGSSFLAEDRGDRIELRAGTRGGTGAQVRYANRAAPLGRNALRHLARGLGFRDDSLVQVEGTWCHFGGALFGRLLELAGLDASAVTSQNDPRTAATVDVSELSRRSWEALEPLCGFGPFHRLLPNAVRREAVVETVRAHGFGEWLKALRVEEHVSLEQRGILEQA